jgi:phosphoglycerol transferase MdoB-like AlkP superfamily enzyme
LKKEGYVTSFFHGADELSMGFKPYLQSQGIDHYFAKQDYPNSADFDGTWGIYDEPFLAYCSTKLSTQKQPWFSGIFTLSSHHPYQIPEAYTYLPEGTNEIHQSIRYTDLALRNFFKSIQSKSWFDNTVFIITADHSSINETPAYRSYRGKYAVPLLIYAPERFDNREENRIVQHIDIYSTIRHLATNDSFVSFGNSLLDDSVSQGVALFDGNIYTYSNDSLTIEWYGDQHTRIFNYRSDPVYSNELSANLSLEAEMMLQKLKLYIQKYNYRLLNNNFNNQ